MTVEMTSLLVPHHPLTPLTPSLPGLAETGAARGSALPMGIALPPESPCLAGDPELWFAETPQGVEEAKARCVPCPVRERCLQGALDRQEPWGVWGGELLLRGVVVPRKRSRGRPRKNPEAPRAAVA